MEPVTYSVIVPCYNTTGIFEKELETIQKVFEERLHTKSFEVILVNDCSPDPSTLDFLKKLHDRFGFVRLVDLVKNTGQANAQVTAMHFVSGEIVINLDDDMQTHPDHMVVLLEKLEEGYDVVLGRYIQKKHNLFRRILTKMDDMFETVFLKKPKELSFTSFWVARRYVIDEITNYPYAYSFMEGLFLRTTRNIANVEIEHHERVEGHSGYTFKSLLRLWSNFTNFSILPLRLAGILGILTTLFGLVFSIVTVVKRLMDPTVPQGYSATICMNLLFFGIILIILGVMGEYIGRIFMCMNASPQFVIKKVYEKEIPCSEQDRFTSAKASRYDREQAGQDTRS